MTNLQFGARMRRYKRDIKYEIVIESTGFNPDKINYFTDIGDIRINVLMVAWTNQIDVKAINLRTEKDILPNFIGSTSMYLDEVLRKIQYEYSERVGI